MLSIKDLEKSYGYYTVLRGLNMSVRKGDIYGFLGTNGCGKTTTMNVICNIIPFNPFAMNLLASTAIMSGALTGSEIMDVISTILFAIGIMAVTFLVALFAQNAKRIDNSGNEKDL